MKRYLSFFYWYFEPSGGMYDFVCDCEKIEDAKELIKKHAEKEHGMILDSYETKEEKYNAEWNMRKAHIYDTLKRKIILICDEGKWEDSFENKL